MIPTAIDGRVRTLELRPFDPAQGRPDELKLAAPDDGRAPAVTLAGRAHPTTGGAR